MNQFNNKLFLKNLVEVNAHFTRHLLKIHVQIIDDKYKSCVDMLKLEFGQSGKRSDLVNQFGRSASL